jgi:hemerythrin-like domain-containing protein/uncharacterized protein (DUF2249 family)
MPRTLPCAAVVDVTTTATATADVLAAFDALAPGEKLRLRTVARPQEALLALAGARRGAFEWVPLLEGPGHWEVEIHRRDARPGTPRGISEGLGWDHDRLDALERSATEAWNAGDIRAGARMHLGYVAGLRRHIRYEDTVLFPEFERLSGLSAGRGPTEVMRIEHRAIEALLEDVHEAASRGVRPAQAVLAELHGVLVSHDVKEENVLYPMLDRGLAADEADRLVFVFQSMDPAA